LHEHDKKRFDGLSGISINCLITSEDKTSFRENILFTHRGLSGPAILQISSYWQAGQAITINLLPDHNMIDVFNEWLKLQGKKSLKNLLSTLLPKRFVEVLIADGMITDIPINQLNHSDMDILASYLHKWQIKPNGTEGYRTAEVTLGGVNTNELSSKTLEANKSKGLYFIGEVVDVTGHLGGFNFQWCWSSGWACGQVC
jgi:predicted Rossmann fold flavoprotein